MPTFTFLVRRLFTVPKTLDFEALLVGADEHGPVCRPDPGGPSRSRLRMGPIAKGAAKPHLPEKADRKSGHVRKLKWLAFEQSAETCPKTFGSGQARRLPPKFTGGRPRMAPPSPPGGL